MTVRARKGSLTLALAVGCAGALLSCHDESQAKRGAPEAGSPVSSSAPPSTAPVTSVTSARASAPLPPPPPAPQRCRAVSVAGSPTLMAIPGTPLGAGASATVTESSDIPDDMWIQLTKDSKLTTRHPRSTRETGFIGPGRVRSCVNHAEEAWVAEGKFASVIGSGERPGAEEWIMTPVGVVRYGSAKLEITVTPATGSAGAKADVKLWSGTAYAWTGDQTGPVKPEIHSARAAAVPDGWLALDGDRTVSFSQKGGAKPEEAAKAAVDRCAEEATKTKALARAVAAPDASLSDVAPRHVVARRIARAACGVGLVRVGQLPTSPVRDALYAMLAQADKDWKGLRTREPEGPKP